MTLGLLALTAFFHLAEMALVAARTSTLIEAGEAARVVLALKKRPGLFLAAVRTGDRVTDLLTGAYVVTWLEQASGSGLAGLPYAPVLAGFGAFVLVSYADLVLGDLVPKGIALAAPERTALLVGSPLRLLILVARPVLILLERSSGLVLRLVGVRPGSEGRITQGEIRRTLSEGLSAGALLSFERTMMERVLDLDHRSVRTVMTGRRYVQSVRADGGPDEIRRAVLGAAASRLPATRDGDLDKLIGTVSRADVLSAIARGDDLDLSAMAAAPAYVSENASVLSVLETLKGRDTSMVVVVDEFGSMIGIATLSDVLEAVAGDVAVADGAPGVSSDGPLEKEPNGTYLVAGAQPVDDIAQILPLSLPAGRGYKTMAGRVLDHLRRLPEEGEVVELASLRIEVVSVQQGTVEMLRLVPGATVTA